ncbi:HEPN domain-containing protein [Holophaga foetida]|uniref:ApeA N-terminal domain 1-containing protein n=1 Tax=Holophaga foetida TaxID=35839 RepID=UPI0002473F28|nr:HEPN domain-containing protein [Holophaga foetida]
MTDLALDAQFAVMGQWHRPEEPGKVLHGQLSRSPKGVELKLDGAFCEVEEAFEGQLHAYPIIHGVSEDFGAVTLLQAHQSGLSRHIRPTGVQVFEKIGAWALLVGGHVSLSHLYPRMRFRIPGLHLWLARPLVKRSLEMNPDSDEKNWVYRIAELDAWSTRIQCIGATLDWEIVGRETNTRDPYSGIQLEVSGWTTLRPDSPKPLEWYLEQQDKIAFMLAWLAGSTMSADQIEAFVDESPNRASLLLKNDRTPCAFDRLWKFFLPRSATGMELNEIVSRWFNVFPEIEKPCRLAHSIFASENLWINLKFLMWIQALEGLHHGMEDAVLMDTLPKDVPLPTSKKKRQPLQERLDALAAIVPQPYRHWVLGAEDTIPHTWIRTRNYYTHWYKDQEEGTLSVQEMHVANVRMEHLSRALFLVLMGVSGEALAATVKGSSETAQELLGINAAQVKNRFVVHASAME